MALCTYPLKPNRFTIWKWIAFFTKNIYTSSIMLMLLCTFSPNCMLENAKSKSWTIKLNRLNYFLLWPWLSASILLANHFGKITLRYIQIMQLEAARLNSIWMIYIESHFSFECFEEYFRHKMFYISGSRANGVWSKLWASARTSCFSLWPQGM